MIAVTGANGQLGQLVIQSLLNKEEAKNIVALVRNPESAMSLLDLGVEVRQADYNKPESLERALKGVKKLLLISSSEVGKRVAQHQSVIDAAKVADVELLAYTSILNADSSPMILAEEHKLTEINIKNSGLPFVVLRNGWYTENYTESIEAVMQSGVVVGAANEGRFHTAARKDYAEAAAEVLTSSGHQGKVYELAGDSGFTLEEYAQEISMQTKKEITYQNMSPEEFTQLLIQAGLPEGFAGALSDSEIHAADGWLANDSHSLSRLIGRATTTLAESVAVAL